MAQQLPRGIRNNNPLNIRLGDNWQGLRQEQTDKAFCQFISMEYGLRAAFVILFNYLKKQVDTPDKIIKRWAPPSENDTEAYINRVCKIGQLPRHEVIKKTNAPRLCRLVWAMAQVECGQVVSYGLIENAYHLALH